MGSTASLTTASTKILLMGKPLTFTKENVGDYNF